MLAEDQKISHGGEEVKIDRSNYDPWKLRGSSMMCKTCMWFLLKEGITGKTSSTGRCRRHAPTMNGYPVVFSSDWCGDHKLDENKI